MCPESRQVSKAFPRGFIEITLAPSKTLSYFLSLSEKKYTLTKRLLTNAFDRRSAACFISGPSGMRL